MQNQCIDDQMATSLASFLTQLIGVPVMPEVQAPLPEVVQLACRVVSSASSMDSTYDECVSAATMTASDINAMDSSKGILELLPVIEAIMEIVMDLINNCDNQQRFQKIASRMPLMAKIWFKVSFFVKKTDGLQISRVQKDDLFDSLMVTAVSAPPETVNAIWTEVREPELDDYSIFS
jgi:hypothetical protein